MPFFHRSPDRMLLLALALCAFSTSTNAQYQGNNDWDLHGLWVLDSGWFIVEGEKCRVNKEAGRTQVELRFTQNGATFTTALTKNIDGELNGTAIGKGSISGSKFEAAESDGTRWHGDIRRSIEVINGERFRVTRVSGMEECVKGVTQPFYITRIDPTPFEGNWSDLHYYKFRYVDFLKRNPSLSPPDYYLQFGDKNLNMFYEKVYSNLSIRGKDFMNKIGEALKVKMEKVILTLPGVYSDLERNPRAFREFAYWTHVDAYCESGWGDLSNDDRDKILSAINITSPLAFNTGASTTFSCGKVIDIYYVARSIVDNFRQYLERESGNRRPSQIQPRSRPRP